MHMSVETHVNASPEAVFAAGTDFANLDKHISGIAKVEVLTDGEIGVGTKFKETRVMFGKEHSEEMTCTSFDSPNSYTLEANSCGMHYVSTFKLTPKDGGTHVALDMTGSGGGCGAMAMAPLGWLMKGKMKKMLLNDLNELKAHVEGRS